MSEKINKGIPYGVTDYEAIRIENSYYKGLGIDIAHSQRNSPPIVL